MFYFRRRPRVGSLARALLGLYDSCSQAVYDICRKEDPQIKGRCLLREWLSAEQRAQFDAHEYFDVIGCHTGKKYRIRYGHYTNVEELDEQDRPAVGWCFVPAGNLVPGDVMLAQKIALETSERGAIAIANTFPVSMRPVQHQARRPF
jgi:hypothetical protein